MNNTNSNEFLEFIDRLGELLSDWAIVIAPIIFVLVFSFAALMFIQMLSSKKDISVGRAIGMIVLFGFSLILAILSVFAIVAAAQVAQNDTANSPFIVSILCFAASITISIVSIILPIRR